MNATYRRSPIATRLLIAINVVVFLLMYRDKGSFDWDPVFLLAWGANHGTETFGDHQYWRLLTACFLHANIFHIMGNMTCLVSWGTALERRFGIGKFLSLYLFAGIFSSIVSAYIHPDGVMVGASGALNGLLGALCTLLLFDRTMMSRSEFAGTALLAIGVNFLPGIDYVGHGAGFVVGAVAGFALWQGERLMPNKPVGRPRWQQSLGDLGARISAAVLPSSDSVAARFVRRLTLRYRSDLTFHVATDVAAISTVMLLFFVNAPSSSVSASGNPPSARSTPANTIAKDAPKPTTMATLPPPQTAKAAAESAATAAPAVAVQYDPIVSRPSLANPIIVDIDDAALSQSRSQDRQKLAAAARAFRSQQYAAMAAALKSADTADANVDFLLGLANLNLAGSAEAKAAEQFLRMASAAGNRQAAALYGSLLVKPPQGVAKDLPQGRSLIENAAASGDRLAQRLAGIGYLSGEFGAVNAAKAREMFRSAAQAGDAPAMLSYAFMLSWALGGPADHPLATDFLRRAASAGLTAAQNILGVWLLDGYARKTLDDPREGVEWLERAYQRGSSMPALKALALFYGRQDQPAPWFDLNKVDALIRLCSGLSDSWCQVVNGWAFDYGKGRSRDPVKAVAHYQVAVELGNTNAPKPLQRAEDLLRTAAEKAAAVELSQAIRAHLKPQAVTWLMQYVGAEPPPAPWATASYDVPGTKEAAPPATAPTAAATPANRDGAPSIILRKSN